MTESRGEEQPSSTGPNFEEMGRELNRWLVQLGEAGRQAGAQIGARFNASRDGRGS